MVNYIISYFKKQIKNFFSKKERNFKLFRYPLKLSSPDGRRKVKYKAKVKYDEIHQDVFIKCGVPKHISFIQIEKDTDLYRNIIQYKEENIN